MKNPYSIQIELVNGCTRQCEFCGLQAVWKLGDRFNFIKMETIEKLSKDLGDWLKKIRVEFAMFGEPTLHPEINDIFKRFRINFPNCQMMLNTNSDTIIDKNNNVNLLKIKEYFNSGLNILLINIYDSDEKYEIVKDKLKNIDFAEFGEFYNGVKCYTYKGKDVKEIILLKSIWIHNKEKMTRTLMNHTGCVPNEIVKKYGGVIITSPLQKMCVNPFREISVKWDGDVNICCMDIKGLCKIGNVNKRNIKDIWYSKKFDELRHKLLDKNRNFEPCCRCNSNGGFRQGLEKRWFEK